MHWLVIAVISDLNSKRRDFAVPNATTYHDKLFCAAPTEPLLVEARPGCSKLLTMVKVWRHAALSNLNT